MLKERKKHSKGKEKRRTKTTKLHIEANNVFFLSIDDQDGSLKGIKEKKKEKGFRCCWVLRV
jgi:hypothetical protein